MRRFGANLKIKIKNLTSDVVALVYFCNLCIVLCIYDVCDCI